MAAPRPGSVSHTSASLEALEHEGSIGYIEQRDLMVCDTEGSGSP